MLLIKLLYGIHNVGDISRFVDHLMNTGTTVVTTVNEVKPWTLIVVLCVWCLQ